MTRLTRETRITVELRPEATGASCTGDTPPADPGARAAPDIATDDAFLGHMLTTLARYAGLGPVVNATGDLRHHLVEDTALALGALLARTTPATCARFGHAVIPMDDALVEVALDTVGRPHFEGRLPAALPEHFFRSLAMGAGWTLHVRVIRGRDRHHVVEAAFKVLGVALRQARRDDGVVFSTKGAVRLEWEERCSPGV